MKPAIPLVHFLLCSALATAIPAQSDVHDEVGQHSTNTQINLDSPTSLAIVLGTLHPFRDKRSLIGNLLKNDKDKDKDGKDDEKTKTHETTSKSTTSPTSTNKVVASTAAPAAAATTNNDDEKSASRTTSSAPQSSSDSCSKSTGKLNSEPYVISFKETVFKSQLNSMKKELSKPENKCENGLGYIDGSKDKPHFAFAILNKAMVKFVNKMSPKPKLEEDKGRKQLSTDPKTSARNDTLATALKASSGPESRDLSLTPRLYPRAPQLIKDTREDILSWGLQRISVGQTDSLDKQEGKNFVYPDSAGRGVDVYVVDEGIARPTHEEITRRVSEWLLGDYVTDPAYIPLTAHATQVGAVIAGKNTGVARKTNLISVKSWPPEYGEGAKIYKQYEDMREGAAALINQCHFSSIRKAKESYLEKRRKGSTRPAIIALANWIPHGIDEFGEEVSDAIAHGMHVVHSAGNDGKRSGDPDSENGLPSVGQITVGSTDQHDIVWTWSGWGPKVDIYAPGVKIPVPYGADPNSGYAQADGSSLAVAHVVGVLATLLDIYPNLTPAEAKRKLVGKAGKAYDQHTNSEVPLLQMDGLFNDLPYRKT